MAGRPTQDARRGQDLASRYHRAQDLADRAWARLTLLEPDSQRAARLEEIHDAAQRKARELHRQAQQPGAPAVD